MQNLFDSISSKCCNIHGNKIQAEDEIKKYLSSYLNKSNENFSLCVDFLKAFQKDFITRNRHKYEIHIILDQNNNYFDCSINPEDGGDLTPKTIDELKKKNLHLIHNHPSNGSLSTSDWNVLFHNPNLKMTAVNQYGSSFTGSLTNKKNNTKIDTLYQKLKNLREIQSSLTQDYSSFINLYTQSNQDVAYDFTCLDDTIKKIETWLNHKLGIILSIANIATYVSKVNESDHINIDNLHLISNGSFQKTIDSIKNW